MGSKDKNIRFFVIPKDILSRKNWIAEIEKVQKFEYASVSFMVCETHFNDTNFLPNRKLKKNVVSSLTNNGVEER